jgi:hypothetical protein
MPIPVTTTRRFMAAVILLVDRFRAIRAEAPRNAQDAITATVWSAGVPWVWARRVSITDKVAWWGGIFVAVESVRADRGG